MTCTDPSVACLVNSEVFSGMPSLVELAADSLRAGFAGVCLPLDQDKRDELRGHVHAFVVVVKAEGWSPERAVIAVKAIAKGAGFETSHMYATGAGNIDEPSGADELLVNAVGWCIRRYFAE
jgi:hypothetical protein